MIFSVYMSKIGDIQTEVKNILDDPNKYAGTVSIIKLVETLKKLSYHYYNTDESLVPDAIYDLLRDTLEEKDPTNPFLKEIGAPISKDSVELPHFMASLNKVKPNKGLKEWIKKYNGPYVLSDKLDGVSGLLVKGKNTTKLYTRGDGKYGQDISYLIPYVVWTKSLERMPFKTVIRGELIISKQNFKKISKDFKNARNAVAGLVNSKNYSLEVAKLTHFVGYSLIHPVLKQTEQYEKLTEWKFPCVDYRVKSQITDEYLINYLSERRDNGKYEVDGIVVADNSNVYQYPKKNPDHAFAFKTLLNDQIAETTILEVEWTPSKDGYIKPRIRVKPVDITGVVVKYATAKNAKYVVDLKLGPGAIIKLVRSGDVIPDILKVVKPAKEPQMPEIPYKWNKTGVDVIVKDIHGAAADTIKVKQITYFFRTLGVKYISEGIITKLVDNGYDSIIKILDGKINKMAQIDGIGEKVLSKIFDNIITIFETTSLEVLMAASNTFGRGIAVKKLKIIVDAYPNIMDINITKKQILDLQGFDDITTSQFIEGIDKFKNFFEELEEIDRITVSHLKKPKKNTLKGNKFSGQKVVFTGFRNKDWEEFITSQGGEISGTVSKNTTLLVHKNSDNSSKYKKALELKIKIMTDDEFEKEYF